MTPQRFQKNLLSCLSLFIYMNIFSSNYIGTWSLCLVFPDVPALVHTRTKTFQCTSTFDSGKLQVIFSRDIDLAFYSVPNPDLD